MIDNLTPIMRDYLAEIYCLAQETPWVSTMALAQNLDVSGPTAGRMAQRLQERDLAIYQPYQGVHLTEAGEKAALLSLRRYRLTKWLLVKVLQYEWHELHAEARKLQPGIDQYLEDKIEILVGYPTTCPHGEPIPTKHGTMPELHDQPLPGLPLGSSGKISRVTTRDAAKLQYIAKLGLAPGTNVELTKRAPFNGPVWLKTGPTERVIGSDLATVLWVAC